MKINEITFEKIEVVLQDPTGFNDGMYFKNVSLNDISTGLPEEYLKEIHLINPMDNLKEKSNG